MLRLWLLFVTITSIEFFLLIKLGSFIGLLATVGLIFLTGFIGAFLTRLQGLRVLRDIATSMQEGRMPAKELLNGVCVLLAGAFLITPGFLTDFVGFSLLIPPIRQSILYFVQKRIQRWIEQHTHTITINPPPFS